VKQQKRLKKTREEIVNRKRIEFKGSNGHRRWGQRHQPMGTKETTTLPNEMIAIKSIGKNKEKSTKQAMLSWR